MAARPAAGSGGTPNKRNASARGAGDARTGAAAAAPSRAQRLRQAHAAGAAGQPAPAWIDDAELLQAYSDGADEAGDTWTGDQPDTASDNDVAAADAAVAEPEPDPEGLTPGPAEQAGSGSGRRSIGPIRATGTSGDVAGAFLGFIGAAFLTNVIKGTWQQWLRAKFLNDTPTSSGSTDTPNFWQNVAANANNGTSSGTPGFWNPPSSGTPGFWNPPGTPAPGNPNVLGRGDLPAGSS